MDEEYTGLTDEETTSDEEVTQAPKKTFPLVLIGIAIVCFLVIVAFIVTPWVTTDEPAAPATEPMVEEPVEVVEEPAIPEAVSTAVVDRDPDTLGLRIDGVIGRVLTVRDSGQTLYTSTEECVDECLGDWTPYLAPAVVVDGGRFSTIERSDSGELQYAWDDRGLYTYNLDSGLSVLGDGYAGTWSIARP